MWDKNISHIYTPPLTSWNLGLKWVQQPTAHEWALVNSSPAAQYSNIGSGLQCATQILGSSYTAVEKRNAAFGGGTSKSSRYELQRPLILHMLHWRICTVLFCSLLLLLSSHLYWGRFYTSAFNNNLMDNNLPLDFSSGSELKATYSQVTNHTCSAFSY
jgi:hypothetical protein